MKRLALRLALALTTFVIGSAVDSVWHRPSAQDHPRFGFSTESSLNSNSPVRRKLRKVGNSPEAWSEVSGAAIQFVSESDGWLSLNGRLWRTTDGGKSWESRFLALNESDDPIPYLGQFQFTDAQTGWVISGDSLYRTRDGGDHWTAVRRAPVDPYSLIGIMGFRFIEDGRHGWLIENRFRPLHGQELRDAQSDPHANLSDDQKHIQSSYILYTVNGGDSWESQSIPPTWNSLYEITALDANHAWAFGIAGIYYLQGNRWEPVQEQPENNYAGSRTRSTYAGFGASPVSIFFIDKHIGWLANSTGYLGKSFDGGKTWTDVSRFPEPSPSPDPQWIKIYFTNHDVGWCLDGSGRLLVTEDGGVSWKMFDDSTRYLGMDFLDAKHGWAMSNDGVFRIPIESKGGSGT